MSIWHLLYEDTKVSTKIGIKKIYQINSYT